MDLPVLAELNLFSYIDSRGAIASNFDAKIGIYAIYDATETLCYIGYSRDFKKSLQQHLVRCPDQCHWLKIHTCDRPSRTLLEEIKNTWIQENGTLPIGNDETEALWTEPIDVKPDLTPEQNAEIAAAEEIQKTKILKNHARRVEAEIKEKLEARGLKIEIRFQPKLKEQGLLDLK
ncbi:hypothetical protein Lepto7376_3933 [[Leptolyngbya] sp. PCC 7376]|uniref:GIY-YIG nuclease family protein n=1 Tax=[Leptolyngbya] sp. PCC 7376 TaxID=111781 RepID=UPI00029F43F1|nr:hypothetical protein Lepto7376_3933 [[Leptolyngbya] sp. PCC 7376]